MSDREPTQRPGGRSGMSVSGTLSIIVAAVAVILGFLILRDINDSGDASNGGDDTETTTTVPGGPNNTTSPPDGSTATTLPAALKPYTVIVANAAKVGGAAGAMTTALQGAGVTTIEGVNSSLTDAQSATTIYYAATYEAEAAALARIMGVTTAPLAMPEPPPLASGASLGTANILVQLGTDKAGQPLPTGGATTATTAASTPTT